MCGGRACPECREIDDAHSGQRRFRGPCAGRGLPWCPKRYVVGFPDRRRRANRCLASDRHEPWCARLPESRGVVDIDATCLQVVHVRDRGTVAEGRQRQPEELSELDDLRDRPLAHPRVDPFTDPVAVVPSPDLEPQLRNLGEVGTVDHCGEVQPLLAGDHADAHVAVLGGLDRRHLHRAFDGWPLQQLRVQPFAALHQRDRLQHGQVQVPARAAARDAAAQCHCAVRCPGRAHVLAEVAADRDRRALGVAAKAGEPRVGLEGELGRGPLRPGPCPAEVGDGHDDAVGPRPQQPRRIDAMRSGSRPGAGHDHNVGGGQEILGKRCDAPLSG